MKSRSALFILMFVLLVAGSCLADSLPPDGNMGIKGGSRSTEITTTNFSFTLTNCSTNPSSDDCQQALAAFGAFPQAAFAGDNDSGVPINRLTLTLNFSPIASPLGESFGCDGGTLFTINNCPTLLPQGTSSVTFTLFKGDGTGIGCYDPGDEGDGDANEDCLENQGGDSPLKLGPNSPNDGPPSHFVIAVGFGTGTWPTANIPTGGAGSVGTPEPGTAILLLTGMAALAARKRRSKV